MDCEHTNIYVNTTFQMSNYPKNKGANDGRLELVFYVGDVPLSTLTLGNNKTNDTVGVKQKARESSHYSDSESRTTVQDSPCQ